MKVSALTSSSLAAEVAALRPSEVSGREVADVVAGLIADVRSRGDTALVEATARYDWEGMSASALAVTPVELEAAHAATDPRVLASLELARDNCTFFHRHELAADWEDVGAQGQTVGVRHLAVERAGLYVPGGLGAYASTVIMNAVPARVAGVGELIVCTPPGRDGSVNTSVLAAARLMGIDRVFRVGGAQAVAAMAFGTGTVPRADVICGPGNAYVMEAKRQVFGAVGIDSLAGPSEVLVIADATSRPDWVAADMLAQEEHGSGSQAVLFADSRALCSAVEESLERLRAADGSGRTPTPVVGAAAGSTVVAADPRLRVFYPASGEDFLQLAAALVNAYAPEHLELHLADPRGFLPQVRSAGAVFLGSGTPTCFGDYVAGSNHVLPTGGSARFSSPLSVNTFMRRSSYVETPPTAVASLTPHVARLADTEGFPFHRASAELRVPREG